MSDRIILGIDPGVGGALAWLSADRGVIAVEDMPVHRVRVAGKDRKAIDLHGLADLIRWYADETALAVIEEVSSMPKQGVASTFTFGRASMAPEAVVATLQIPYQTVRPHVWKRVMQVKGDKDEARRRAGQLYPESAHRWSRQQDDGRAEAAMLAGYGLKTTGADR